MKRIIVGIGMAGANFVHRNYKRDILSQMDFAVIDCDQALLSVMRKKVKTYYYEDENCFDEELSNDLMSYDQVIFVTGLGKRSGQFAITMASGLKEKGMDTIGCCIIPFDFETNAKKEALQQVKDLLPYLNDSLVLYDNSMAMLCSAKTDSMDEVYQRIDDHILERLIGKIVMSEGKETI